MLYCKERELNHLKIALNWIEQKKKFRKSRLDERIKEKLKRSKNFYLNLFRIFIRFQC